MYLKENAELLNIVECTGVPGGRGLGRHYRAFHAEAPAFLSFFPQYYRFILSIVTDAERLGLRHGTGAALAALVARDGLAEGEISDLQRMEARRLCARHGVTVLAGDGGLDDRAIAFMSRPAAFAVPNRKAAYDLTHFVFYFSEYGRRRPDLPDDVARSLTNVGLIAMMEEDIDLLSEVCIALRYLGRTPPAAWEGYIAADLADFELFTEDDDDHGALHDDYHPFLVANWHQAVAGGRPFVHAARPGRLVFRRRPENRCTLMEISEILLHLSRDNRLTIGALFDRLHSGLSPRSRKVFEAVGRSSPQFEEFLYGFCHRTRGIEARV